MEHERTDTVVVVVLVHVATGEDELRVVDRAHATVEELAVRLVWVDVLPSVGPVLFRELSIVGWGNTLGIVASFGLVIEAINIEVVDAKVHNVLTGSCSTCPFALVVGERQQRRTIKVTQQFSYVIGHVRGMMSILQLAVGKWACGIGEHDSTGCQCGSDGGTHSVALVTTSKLQFLCGLEHLVGNVGGTLFVSATWRSQLIVLQRVVGTFVCHNGHRTELAQ